MARKLSTLFFSAARKVARLQRTAWSLSMPGGLAAKPAKRARARPARRPASATDAAAADAAAAGAGSADTAQFDPADFAGSWKSRIYRTPPVPGTWPVRLSYYVYVPPRLRKGAPVLMMLHGCEQSAVDFALGTRMHRLADREGVLLVYPEQSRRGQRHRCWHWYRPDTAHGYAEADAIAGIAAAVIQEYQADPTRVYIAGLSAGAGIAALAALRHPERFAALGMHSGAVLGSARTASEGLRAMRHGAAEPPAQAMAPLLPDRMAFPGMPVIILQGDRDAVVDRRSGPQLLAQWAWANGLDTDKGGAAESRPEAAGTPRHYLRTAVPPGKGAMVVLCEVPGLGHAWSGGDGRVRFHARHGPDASRLMWRFFKDRRRLPELVDSL
ncbi:alpha/beta hydrolase family esterase [Bordetella bronchialis]|uniref:extracellular catalytic domain type 1 short-chain-length polyhydroxyalkanoate depolymerase n=1 Tax=Bordetella bronchialis TaxID=463025 RepID=UPI003CFDD301